MFTALRNSPVLLNRVLPVLCFDRNLLIPDILNSIKLIFRSNGCQGIEISCLFFEKNKFSMRKDRFRTSAKQDTSHLFMSGHFENRSFLPILQSPHRTLHNQIKYFSWSNCNEPNIFLKRGNSFNEICCFGNKLYSRFYERDLIGNRYTQTAKELLNRIRRKQSLTTCVDHHV